MSFVCVVIAIFYGLLYLLTKGSKEGAVIILGTIWFLMCMFAGACAGSIGFGIGVWLFTTAIFIFPLIGGARSVETKKGREKIRKQKEQDEKFYKENWYYIEEQKEERKSKK